MLDYISVTWYALISGNCQLATIYYHYYYNKVAFLGPISSKIKLEDEKESTKRRSREEGRRGGEKSNGCTVSFYIKQLDGEGPFAGKMQLDMNICISLQCMYGAGWRSYLINSGIL